MSEWIHESTDGRWQTFRRLTQGMCSVLVSEFEQGLPQRDVAHTLVL